MRIGVDLDNVLNKNAKSIAETVNSKYGLNIREEDFIRYHVETCTPITKEMLDEMFNDPNYFLSIEPNNTVINFINLLYELHHEIYIITDRPENCWMSTLEWLFKNKVRYNQVYLRKANEKPTLAEDLKLDVFIEDRLDTSLSLANIVKVIYLLDRPWNQGRILPNITRLTDDMLKIFYILDF